MWVLCQTLDRSPTKPGDGLQQKLPRDEVFEEPEAGISLSILSRIFLHKKGYFEKLILVRYLNNMNFDICSLTAGSFELSLAVGLV